MIVRKDQFGQLRQIEGDDHNTYQSCSLACDNDHTCDALFLARKSDCNHHVKMPKQRNHQRK